MLEPRPTESSLDKGCWNILFDPNRLEDRVKTEDHQALEARAYTARR